MTCAASFCDICPCELRASQGVFASLVIKILVSGLPFNSPPGDVFRADRLPRKATLDPKPTLGPRGGQQNKQSNVSSVKSSGISGLPKFPLTLHPWMPFQNVRLVSSSSSLTGSSFPADSSNLFPCLRFRQLYIYTYIL